MPTSATTRPFLLGWVLFCSSSSRVQSDQSGRRGLHDGQVFGGAEHQHRRRPARRFRRAPEGQKQHLGRYADKGAPSSEQARRDYRLWAPEAQQQHLRFHLLGNKSRRHVPSSWSPNTAWVQLWTGYKLNRDKGARSSEPARCSYGCYGRRMVLGWAPPPKKKKKTSILTIFFYRTFWETSYLELILDNSCAVSKRDVVFVGTAKMILL